MNSDNNKTEMKNLTSCTNIFSFNEVNYKSEKNKKTKRIIHWVNLCLSLLFAYVPHI